MSTIKRRMAARIQVAIKMTTLMPEETPIFVAKIANLYIRVIRKESLILIQYGDDVKFEQIATHVDAKMSTIAKQACEIMGITKVPADSVISREPFTLTHAVNIASISNGCAFAIWRGTERVNVLYHNNVFTFYSVGNEPKYHPDTIITRQSLLSNYDVDVFNQFDLYYHG